MSTIAKENEVLTHTPEAGAARPAAPAARTEEPAARPQPVALEVPVTVNGARTVEGSDKREPFSESTKTVLIFGNGAVIRLASAVAPGQLLFLTNEKTRKEVVCQVVKSKNYRNVSGYVELEFTEAVLGFWGMRFPSDKIGSGSPAASRAPASSAPPAAPPKLAVPVLPVAPKTEAVVAASNPKISEIKPVLVAPIIPPLAPALPITPVTPIQAAEIAPAPQTIPEVAPLAAPEPVATVAVVAPVSVAPVALPPVAAAPVAPVAIEATPLPHATEEKVIARAEVTTPAVLPAEDSTEALRQQTARLQEQLSSLLFAEASATKEIPVQVPSVDAAAVAESASKILAFANPEPAPPAILPPPPPVERPQPVIENSQSAIVTPPPSPVKSFLDVDEDVKIPAWLEPLARNAAAPVSTQELIEREKAKHAAALHAKSEIKELVAEPLPAQVSENSLNLQVPTFGSELSIDHPQFSGEISSQRSKTPIWLGLIAAALFLAAGGAWYLRQQFGPAQAAPIAAPASTSSAPSNGLQSPSQASPSTKSSAFSPASGTQASSSPTGASSPAARNQSVQPASSTQAGSLLNANAKIDAPRSAELVQPVPQPKKASLGEVRLAAPTVKRNGAGEHASEPEPAIEGSGNNNPSADPGSGILGGNSKQPAAPAVPLPVGGDVKSAKLISSIPPVYSSLARAQHVSGDVKIDALIDVTGRVTTMKVVSGPTLLHQAAMDALRQWKYQPAALDGKAVSMHLTVTIQFRMQ